MRDNLDDKHENLNKVNALSDTKILCCFYNRNPLVELKLLRTYYVQIFGRRTALAKSNWLQNLGHNLATSLPDKK